MFQSPSTSNMSPKKYGLLLWPSPLAWLLTSCPGEWLAPRRHVEMSRYVCIYIYMCYITYIYIYTYTYILGSFHKDLTMFESPFPNLIFLWSSDHLYGSLQQLGHEMVHSHLPDACLIAAPGPTEDAIHHGCPASPAQILQRSMGFWVVNHHVHQNFRAKSFNYSSPSFRKLLI